MKKTARIISLLLVLCLLTGVITIIAACKEKTPEDPTPDGPKGGQVYNDFKVGGRITIGNTTQMGGDFRFLGLGQSSVNAADQDITRLTRGYATMELNQGGAYVWNNTVIKSHNEEEIEHNDGSLTYRITMEINSGLKMSDGTEVKAANYLAYTLATSTPVVKEARDYDRGGYSLVGWDSFHKYDGTNAATDGSITKEFSGLRLLDTYKFSIEIGSDDYPYYYAGSLGAITPFDLKLVLGEGVEVKDDGEGAYLSEGWYAKSGDSYSKATHFNDARWDVSTYAYTGPYTVSAYNKTSNQVTLKLNPNYAGNFEGQKPHIETIVYTYVVQETQISLLSSGGIDILAGITGATDTNNMLALIENSKGKLATVQYDRAGYGKIEFDCDFSPTMFAEVRQAVAYAFDRNEFSQAFTGGYGSVVHGPYSVNFDAYIEQQDKLEANLNPYAVSVQQGVKALENGGWIYNSDGSTPFDATKGTGIRYKKLAADEYGPGDVNLTYKAVSVTDGKTYQTVKIGNDYYMPLAINWLASSGNTVSDLLTTQLQKSSNVSAMGMLITKTVVDFDPMLDTLSRDGEGYSGTPTYGMYNLATGWSSAEYDYAYNWIGRYDSPEMYENFFFASMNKLSDKNDLNLSWWKAENQGLSFDEAAAKAGGADKLGMNYISFAMVYNVKPNDTKEFNKWFYQYMIRWNELLPDIPLYSNIYFDAYNSDILNFQTTPFFGVTNALLYCGMASAQ